VASLRWVGRRAADLGRGVVDTFLRDNRLLPPILALLALFVFAWVLAGVFIGRTGDQKPVAQRADIAQANGDAAGPEPAAPEVVNPNIDSYAAYRSKDPFREVLADVQTTPEGTAPEGTTPEAPTPAATTPEPAERTTPSTSGTTGGGPASGANNRAPDSDRDGLPDRDEATFKDDPNNPDTDGDGIPDGLEDSDGDGIPDGVEAAVAASNRNNSAGPGNRGTGGQQGQRGNLLNSGGTLPPP
jgi:hypothetical protein